MTNDKLLSLLTRKLDWDFTYVKDEEVFPPLISGQPWLGHALWKNWDEPVKTTFAQYVEHQSEKKGSTGAAQAIGKIESLQQLPRSGLSSLKLHMATLPLAEFAAAVGNMRGARFGRDSAWRMTSLLGGLDGLRRAQAPLLLLHELAKGEPQFDWARKFYHTNNWVSIAARRMLDELLLTSNPIEFAVATHFVFETGFASLQFTGLGIQGGEARHSRIGLPVLQVVMEHDKDYAQYLLDKWFWRCWLFFAIVTGFSMDYLAPLESRARSFKEFMEEGVIDQYLHLLKDLGLKKPWYWETFLNALDSYHHMVYAAAYSYRSTVWFDLVVPGPSERAWLAEKYPRYWGLFDAMWRQISERWEKTDPNNDFGVHGTAIVTFCDLCQIVLSNGTPKSNAANILLHGGRKYVFCSQPCRWIFEKEPERYAEHKSVVQRVLQGEAPGNVIALIRQYFELDYGTWGKDAFGGEYPWMERKGGH